MLVGCSVGCADGASDEGAGDGGTDGSMVGAAKTHRATCARNRACIRANRRPRVPLSQYAIVSVCARAIVALPSVGGAVADDVGAGETKPVFQMCMRAGAEVARRRAQKGRLGVLDVGGFLWQQISLRGPMPKTQGHPSQTADISRSP